MSERRAFIFPGQASQYVGMAKDLCEKFPRAQELFARANQLLGFDIQPICFAGPEEKLNDTRWTQPALLTAGVATYRAWSAAGGSVPAFMAGRPVPSRR